MKEISIYHYSSDGEDVSSSQSLPSEGHDRVGKKIPIMLNPVTELILILLITAKLTTSQELITMIKKNDTVYDNDNNNGNRDNDKCDNTQVKDSDKKEGGEVIIVKET